MKKTDTIKCGFKRLDGKYVPWFDTIDDAITSLTSTETQERADKYTPGTIMTEIQFYVGDRLYKNVEEVYEDE